MNIYEAMEKRRSTRKYLSDDIGSETLNKIMQYACMAPSAGNLKPWEFVLVRDRKAIQTLCEVIAEAHEEYFGSGRKNRLESEKLNRVVQGYAQLEVAPAFVLACMNIRTYLLEDRYAVWERKWAEQGMAAAMENLTLAATAEGIGTCWLGVPAWRQDELRALFNIPVTVDVFAVSPLGYPKEALTRRTEKSLDDVIHQEKWPLSREG